jgi:putative hydrolase of the HAD superfamily
MKKAVLFDLGGTLAYYYERSEFPEILRQSIAEVKAYLNEHDILNVSPDEVACRLREEDHEAGDHHVRPLEERLRRIFQIGNSANSEQLTMTLSRVFMKPIFARGRCYDETIPTLEELRARGFKTGIVSNTSWGSPANLWREEIERLRLAAQMDAVVFCRDVGWRKPSRQIFEFTLKQIDMRPQDCIFVGDHPEWDLIGAQTVGIDAILIDRQGILQHDKTEHITSLRELLPRLRVNPSSSFG